MINNPNVLSFKRNKIYEPLSRINSGEKNKKNKSLKKNEKYDQLEVARVQRGGMSSAQKKGRFVQDMYNKAFRCLLMTYH